MPRPHLPYEFRPGRWRFRLRGEMVYRDGAGKVLESEVAARRELRRRLGGSAAQTPRSVATLLDAYEDARGSGHTVALAERFAGWARGDYAALATLPASTLVDYAAWLKRQTTARGTPFAPKSVKHYVSAAASVLQWGIDRGYVTVAIRRPRLPKSAPNPKPIARATLAAAYRSLRRRPKVRHLVSLLRVGVLTGIRPVSLRMLRWDDVDLERGYLSMMRHKSVGVTGSAVIVPIGRRVVVILSRLTRHPSGYVWVSSKGTPYKRAGLRSIWKRAGITPYAMRHTFAQAAMDAGARQEDVSAAMGHVAGSEIVKMYARLSAERVRSVADLVERRGLHRAQPAPRRASAPSPSAQEKRPPTPRKRAKVQSGASSPRGRRGDASRGQGRGRAAG